MNCNTPRDRETYRFYQAAINALELRVVEDAPGCTVPPLGFVPRPCKDTALTAFAQLGALRLNANRGLISLLDGRYQYILAEATRTLPLLDTIDSDPNDDLWLGSVIIPRSRGVCEHVLSLGDVMHDPIHADSDIPAVVINDLAEDPRFEDRSYVLREPKVRFYAGVPLRSPWGTIIGAYCVFGHEPRNGLTQEQLLAIQGIATTVMAYLETSKAKEGHRRYERMLHGLTSFVTGKPSITPLSSPQHLPPGRPTPTHHLSSNSVGAGSGPEDPGPQTVDVPSTLHQRTQSPKGKKRPRVLSTSTATARKKSTMSLQETMLPSGSKKMFSRAASMMRESIDVCGCIIFDASLASYGATINSPYERGPVKAHFDAPRDSIDGVSSKHDRGSDDPSPHGNPLGSEIQTSSSDGDGSFDTKMCEVLGLSIEEATDMPITDSEVFCPKLAEKDLKKLLKRFPLGHIFNSSSANNLSPSRRSEHPPEMAPSSEAIDGTTSGVQGPTRAPEKNEDSLLQKLLKTAPGARSIALLPLWDYQRNRWFAGCLLWTTESSRVLYPDVDLIYLQAFGNSIMMELSRLDAITSDEAKTTFVASISHELRCPLHGILGGVQFLQDTSLDAHQSGMLDSVAMCGRTLLDTIDHVLDFAKVNTFTKEPLKASGSRRQEPIDLVVRKGSQSLSEPANLFANVDLAMLTEEVVEAVFAGHKHRESLIKLEHVNELTGTSSGNALLQSSPGMTPHADNNLGRDNDNIVRLILDIPHRENWTVTTQPGAWRRIVMNLVGNALKYTTSGHIRVSMLAKQSGVDVPQESNIDVTLTVSDSGKGISAEYSRGGLWRPFSQEDSFSPGTGLGLSIVRQIVQGLRGTIDLKSEVHVGTEVKVNLSLPLAESPSEADDEDSYISLATAQVRNRSTCLLETTSPEDLGSLIQSVQRGRHELGVAVSKTLKAWFGADAVVSNLFTALSADVIICLEPRLELLSTLTSMLIPGKKPLIIFIVLHVGEAAKIRSDPRVQSSKFIVDVIAQPCGPRKLAKALIQDLDQRDRQIPLTTTPLASPTGGTPRDISPIREWQSPNWLPTHVADAQSNSRARANSILDPTTIPRTLVERHSTNASALEPPTTNHLRILLVDDNRINLSLLTAFMRRYKFDYEEAANGLEAVNMYKRSTERFDYVLMDLTMPVMDGMTATREIRRHEQRVGMRRPTIVIALTGLASAAARVDALNSGINFFLTKPVKFQALYSMLKGVTASDGEGGSAAGPATETSSPAPQQEHQGTD